MRKKIRGINNLIQKVKVNYYWNIIRGFLTFVGLVFLMFMFTYSIFKMTDLTIENPGAAAVFGTILGAVIAGFFSYLGAKSVFSGQIKAQANIKRKNEIYIPLYNELLKAHNKNITNKYPILIAFEEVSDPRFIYPVYVEWEKIKNDSRSIEMVSFIAEELEELFRMIDEYLLEVDFLKKSVVDKILEVLEASEIFEKKDTSFAEMELKLYKDAILKNILLKNKSMFDGAQMTLTYFDLTYNFEEPGEYDNMIGSIAYEECRKLPGIIKLEKTFLKWMLIEKKVLKNLENIIKTINLKYEN